MGPVNSARIYCSWEKSQMLRLEKKEKDRNIILKRRRAKRRTKRVLNIMQVKMGYVTFMSTQHDSFIKRVKWVGLDQPALLTGQVRVERT